MIDAKPYMDICEQLSSENASLRSRIQALEAENAKLRGDDDALPSDWQAPTDEQFSQMREIAAEGDARTAMEHPAVVARIHALETALEPFAWAEDHCDMDFPEDTTLGHILSADHITLGDLRRARSVLSEKTAGKAQEAPKASEGAL